MGSKSTPSTLLILCLVIFKCLISTEADDACPYPCIPPPIAGTTTPTTPGVASYPPPAPPAYYSPPTPTGGYSGYSGGGGLTAPPPPDPILPYFPYYYRNGVHRPTSSDQTSSSTAPRLTARIVFLTASFASAVLLS